MACHAPCVPLGIPKPVAPDVWIIDGPEVRMRYMGLAVPFPTRATVICLPGGALWVHSPVAINTEGAARLDRIGTVRFLVAPNTLHMSWMADWKRNWPAARTYGPPGRLYRGGAVAGFDEILGPQPPAAWGDAFDQTVVSGYLLTEVVFFHRPSQTLVLTDLIENFEPQRV